MNSPSTGWRGSTRTVLVWITTAAILAGAWLMVPRGSEVRPGLRGDDGAGAREPASDSRAREARTFATRRPRPIAEVEDARSSESRPIDANEVAPERPNPIIRGRVVAGEPPAPMADATCRVTLSGSDVEGSTSVWSADDGRFEFSAGWSRFRCPQDPPVTRVELVARLPSGLSAKPVVLDPVPDHDVDLGDVAIEAGTRISYFVVDSSGAPIEGAYARITRQVSPSTRTDASGRGTIAVGRETSAMWVGALRHEVLQVPVTAAMETLTIVLQPSSGLDVKVVAESGVNLGAISVRVAAPNGAGVFAAPVSKAVTPEGELPWPPPPPGEGPDPVLIAAGATDDHGSGWGCFRGSYRFALSSDGHVVLAGLARGVPLTLTAVDALDHPLAAAEAICGDTGWKSVDLRIAKSPRTLRGCVRDPAGFLISGARVMLSSTPHPLDAPAVRVETGLDGRFTIGDLYEGVMDLTVEKAGCVSLIQHDFKLRADDSPVELVLDHGCTVRVEVVDASGAPIPHLEVSTAIEGFPKVDGDEKAPGVYWLADMPAGAAATITTVWAQRAWTQSVAVKDGAVVKMAMPAAGKLLVDWSEVDVHYPALELTSAEDPSPRVLTWHCGDVQRSPILPPRFPPVWETGPIVPGVYEARLRPVSLQVYEGPENAEPQIVTVRPGETTRIVFKKPQ